MLKRITATEFTTIERLLDRWADPRPTSESLLTAYAIRLAKKARVVPPPAEQRLRFLEDPLLAELRRRDRSLP